MHETTIYWLFNTSIYSFIILFYSILYCFFSSNDSNYLLSPSRKHKQFYKGNTIKTATINTEDMTIQFEGHIEPLETLVIEQVNTSGSECLVNDRHNVIIETQNIIDFKKFMPTL